MASEKKIRRPIRFAKGTNSARNELIHQALSTKGNKNITLLNLKNQRLRSGGKFFLFMKTKILFLILITAPLGVSAKVAEASASAGASIDSISRNPDSEYEAGKNFLH